MVILSDSASLENIAPHYSEEDHRSFLLEAAKFVDEVSQIQSKGVQIHFCVNKGQTSTQVIPISIDILTRTDSTSDNQWVQKAYPYYGPNKINDASNLSNQENLEKINLQKLLSESKENECQNILNEILVESMKIAISTSDNSCGMFSAAKTVGNTKAVSVQSAIPDIIGKLSPQLIEIKASPITKMSSDAAVTTDLQLVNQMLTRISTVINTVAFLSSFTVVGATGRSGWVMEFTRNVESFKQRGEEFERIEIRRIPHSEVLKIFLSNHERSIIQKNWFFTCDAPHIINTISRLSYPFLCSVRLLDCSESRVYYVALPRVHEDFTADGKSKNIVGPSANENDFAIKVVHNDAQFTVEVEALTAISCQYNAMWNNNDVDKMHYAIGSCSYGGNALQSLQKCGLHEKSENAEILDSTDIFIDLQMESNSILQNDIVNLTNQYQDLVNNTSTKFQQFDLRPWVKYTHPCDWRNTLLLRDNLMPEILEGGTIVMRIGSALTTSEVNSSVWLSGVCKCLFAGWKASWSQGDVRLRNMMKFGRDSYQLIDYNHAIKLTYLDENEAVRYGFRMFSQGSLYDSLGPRLANQNLGEWMKWYATDDYEMCMTALRKSCKGI